VLTWTEQFGADRLWAVEARRHLSRRFEQDLLHLLGAGERSCGLPPSSWAHARDSARSYGKSDPIDVLTVARAGPAEPDLPIAYLDRPSREVRLFTNHREDSSLNAPA
jgi:hypothetical protein